MTECPCRGHESAAHTFDCPSRATSARTATVLDGHINELLRLSAIPDYRSLWNVRLDARTSLAVLDRLREATAPGQDESPRPSRIGPDGEWDPRVDSGGRHSDDPNFASDLLYQGHSEAFLRGLVDYQNHGAEARPFNGLDADRLALAIENHSHVGAPSERVIACNRGHVDRCAPAIAVAYVRLSGAA